MRKELDFFKRNGYFPYPKTMQIEITTMCPLRCPQCFIHEFPISIWICNYSKI